VAQHARDLAQRPQPQTVAAERGGHDQAEQIGIHAVGDGRLGEPAQLLAFPGPLTQPGDQRLGELDHAVMGPSIGHGDILAHRPGGQIFSGLRRRPGNGAP
jgi:hypothetical protein